MVMKGREGGRQTPRIHDKGYLRRLKGLGHIDLRHGCRRRDCYCVGIVCEEYNG